jgi:hypothetical protein
MKINCNERNSTRVYMVYVNTLCDDLWNESNYSWVKLSY